MLPARPVACLARNSGRCRGRVENAFGDRRRHVTAEAAAHFSRRDAPRHRLVDVARRIETTTRRDVESSDRVVITDARLVEDAFALEEERLADVADTERPGERRGRALASGGHRIHASLVVGRYFVGVRALRRREATMLAQHGRVVRPHCRPRHRGRRLCRRLRRMALRARLRADEILARSRRFGRPPAWTLHAVGRRHLSAEQSGRAHTDSDTCERERHD